MIHLHQLRFETVRNWATNFLIPIKRDLKTNDNDLLQDIDWLASRLGNLKLLFNLATLEPMFSHGDFIWSTFATELVYDRLVAMITPAVTADYCAAPGHGETTSECRLEPTTWLKFSNHFDKSTM